MHRPSGPALCDSCYLDREFDIKHKTARRVEHWRAGARMAVMDYNAEGWGIPEAPSCSPILAGGVFNLRAGR